MRNDDNILEALKALDNALGLMARHVRAEVDAEVIEEANMALDYISRVLSLRSIASLRDAIPTDDPSEQSY